MTDWVSEWVSEWMDELMILMKQPNDFNIKKKKIFKNV